MKANTAFIKQLNIETLRKALRNAGQATKPELAELTGLTVVTINALITELVVSKEVIENGNVPSGGGRPSMQYRYNYDYQCAAIVYGYQKNNKNCINTIVVNLAGEVLWKNDEYIETVEIKSFETVLDEVFKQYSNIKVIIFGLPGEVIDEVVTINDYSNIIGPDFIPHYKNKYKVPVLAENDINAMTYGYYRTHNSEYSDSVVGMYFPRNHSPGAGLIIDGSIYYGKQHFSGEIAAMPMPRPWEEMNYFDENEVIKNLEQLLTVYCCTIAPSMFILYGDFFTDTIEERLKLYTEKLLSNKFIVNIEVSDYLERDYEYGLKCLALDTLWEEN